MTKLTGEILMSLTMATVLAYVGSACQSAPTGKARPILYAHYMHCYILGGMADLIGNNQPPFRDVSVDPTQWPEAENKDRTWWSARLTHETQGGLPAVREDFRLGEQAGLDAFALLIGSDHLPGSQFAPGMRLAAQAAQTSKVKLIPDLWADFPGLDEDGERLYGQHVKAFMDAYPRAFLQRDGRWLLSLGCPIGYGRSHDNFVEWSRVKPFFDAWGGPDKFYIVLNTTWDAGDLTTGWGNVCDAVSMWTPPMGWGDRAPKGPDVLWQFAKQYGKQVSWPVHSTYFGGRKGCESMAECLGESTFTDMWREAIDHHAALAAVQSWNDFSEDHAITESNYRGDTLITLNRYFADWFHNGAPPKISHERAYLFHHHQLLGAQLTQSTILAHNDSWHNTPTVDYLNVITMLKKPAHVSLTDGATKWNIDAPSGFHEWLVYVPSARTEAGPKREAYDHKDGTAYPVTTKQRTVTIANSIAAGTPIVTIMRGGKTVATLLSRMPLSGESRWQDLATIGGDVVF